ncbi:kinase-like protein [Byssothecium circinans]|uniref:EKC/KEOPS complex subunit BUD32 n=1 Tax=Byssothecium circinans TaxID=147558 RepID=A0A6A5U0S2_9PLEO|nr:kinase-like protein [Byssothecium circinans]
MSHITHVHLHQHLPHGVKRIIAHGGGCWIGEVDKSTVLKYPHTAEEMKQIRIEAQILSILGSHPRIVQSRGLTEDGLLLEFVPNGNLHDYLLAHPESSLQQRLVWCTQLTEAVTYIHSRRVLHCDLRHDNILVDLDLDLKLADFQGQYFSNNGEILLDGLSLESTKAYLPRKPADHASIRTDLFALGSALHFIIMGQEVFSDLAGSKDEEEISRRFSAGEFPLDNHICAAITEKCWKQLYSSASQVLADLGLVRDAIARGETLEPDSTDALPPTVSWLSGLCDDVQPPKVPPPYRQLIGFEQKYCGIR